MLHRLVIVAVLLVAGVTVVMALRAGNDDSPDRRASSVPPRTASRPHATPDATTLWASAQIRELRVAGVLRRAGLRRARPYVDLDQRTARRLVRAAIADGAPLGLARHPAATVSLQQLHALVLQRLGMRPWAATAQARLRAAGYRPPENAGVAIVVSALGLRIEHHSEADVLERGPRDAVSRQEAYWILAGARRLQPAQTRDALTIVQRLRHVRAPHQTIRRRVLQSAVSQLGMPYIWGGITTTRQRLFGVDVPAGFDCSGLLIWSLRQADQDGYRLLGGRVTQEFARRRPHRLQLALAQPGDVALFGDSGMGSSPDQIGHTSFVFGPGLYLQSGWSGVAIVRADDDSYQRRFAGAIHLTLA